MTRRHVALGTAAAAAAVVLLAACGSSGGGASTITPAGGGAPNGTAADALHSVSTSLGPVLADSRGRTVYELVGDSVGHSTCTGGCTSIWPPVKANGTQVVVNGHPAYTFSGDSGKGQTNGQGVTDTWGRWLALGPGGTPVGAAASSPSTGASQSGSGGGSGGYGY